MKWIQRWQPEVRAGFLAKSELHGSIVAELIEGQVHRKGQVLEGKSQVLDRPRGSPRIQKRRKTKQLQLRTASQAAWQTADPGEQGTP